MRKLETIQTKENLNEVYAMDEPATEELVTYTISYQPIKKG